MVDDKIVMEIDTSASGSCDKIDKLLTAVEKLVNKVTSVEKKLNGKCDVSVVENLESRLNKLEDRLNKGETNLEQRLAAVDEHMSKFIENKLEGLEVGNNPKAPANVLEQALKEEISKQLEEDKDIEDRRCNIILYKIPEDVTADFSSRKEHDLKFVNGMLETVFRLKIQDGDIEKMFRLGKLSREAEVARPLLVRFAEISMKEEVMSNVRNLREATSEFTNISISHDLTPRQRDEIKAMVAAAKKEHADTCM